MTASLRTTGVSIALMLIAIVANVVGVLFPTATGTIVGAILGSLSAYAAWGTDSRLLKIVTTVFAVLMVLYAIATNLVAAGLIATTTG